MAIIHRDAVAVNRSLLLWASAQGSDPVQHFRIASWRGHGSRRALTGNVIEMMLEWQTHVRPWWGQAAFRLD